MLFKRYLLGGLWASTFRLSPNTTPYNNTASQNSLFVISINYTSTLSEVDKHIESHRAFLEDNYKNNIFMASGRKIPRTGGIILASNTDKRNLENIIQKDPFYQNGIAQYTIEEFSPTMYNKNFLKVFKHVENKGTMQEQEENSQIKSDTPLNFSP